MQDTDWVKSPRKFVEKIFHSNNIGNWEEKITEHYTSRLAGPDKSEIPWLSPDSKCGGLVRHVAMVQDIMDQELYAKEFVVRNKENEEYRGTGKYSDMFTPQDGYEIDWDDARQLKRDSRLVYYCVPVPGRNTWTLPRGDDVTRPRCSHVVEMVQGRKRGPEDEGGPMDTSEDGGSKKVKDGEKLGTVEQDTSTFQGLNMVLPTDKGVCCVALIYTSEDNSPFKINDIIEITGIVERLQVDTSCGMDFEETARFPPSSIVPRVHCLNVTKVSHTNPLLPCHTVDFNSKEVKEVLYQVDTIRQELLSVIKECVHGDPVAAEYLLLHLLSSVYVRRDDVMALGKFTMNLTNCPDKDTKFVECISTLLSTICEKSFTFPMTVSNFNNSTMIPRKDYKANRLVSGLLQLPKGIQVVLDETVLEAGQLKARGVENLKSVGNLLSWQKLAYDFGFNYTIEFECDAKCLIISQGKSLLPSDVMISLKPMNDTPDYDTLIDTIRSSTELIEKFRKYLTVVQHINYDKVSDDLQSKIEEDFVAQRKAHPDKVTGETLHRSLVVSRLYAISRAHLTLTEDDWHSAKKLETDRVNRMG